MAPVRGGATPIEESDPSSATISRKDNIFLRGPCSVYGRGSNLPYAPVEHLFFFDKRGQFTVEVPNGLFVGSNDPKDPLFREPDHRELRSALCFVGTIKEREVVLCLFLYTVQRQV